MSPWKSQLLRIARSRWGRFQFFRNVLVGWTCHSLQDRDKTEIAFHVAIEVFVFLALLPLTTAIFFDWHLSWLSVLIVFLAAHTIMWLADGFAHSYVHDSLLFLRNSGIDQAIVYLKTVRNAYSKSNATDCVLIYGSFCRRAFHNRSDLDIRVIRRKGTWAALSALLIALRLKWLSVLMRLPTDLLVVDSMDFVRRQMREDEHPVVLLLRGDASVPEAGLDFEAVVADPSLVLKSAQRE